MAMQTIPSRLTIWTSFKGLPTASPFHAKRNDAAQFGCAVLSDSASHAKRNDAARRSDGTRKFQSPWGGTLGQPHGLFNFPALIRTPLADLLACVLRRRCRPLRRQSAPFTAPLHLRPMSVAAGAGALSLFAPARGILALLSVSLFRIRPVMVIFPS